MLQKGVLSDVSLHRESGQVLDVEDTLDFGDCYAGLVAVRTFWLSNCCSGADQRVLDITLFSDSPGEIDFDISQSIGSSSLSRDLEFDTAAKRRDQGIITAASASNNNDGVLHSLLQQDLQQSKYQRDRQAEGVRERERSRTDASEGPLNATGTGSDGSSSNVWSPTSDRNDLESRIASAQIGKGSNTDKSKPTSPSPGTSNETSDFSALNQNEESRSSHWRQSRPEAAPPLSLADANYSKSTNENGDVKVAQVSEIEANVPDSLSLLSRPASSSIYNQKQNKNVSSSRPADNNSKPSVEEGYRAEDVWGASRNNNILSYVVNLSAVMFGSGLEDDCEALRTNARSGDGFDGICGGYVCDDKFFVGVDIYKSRSATSSKHRLSGGSMSADQLSGVVRKEGIPKAAKRSVGGQKAYAYGDRDGDAPTDGSDRDRERERERDVANGVNSNQLTDAAGIASVATQFRPPPVLRLEQGERKKVTVIFRPGVSGSGSGSGSGGADRDVDIGALVGRVMSVTIEWIAVSKAPVAVAVVAVPPSTTVKSTSTFMFSDGNASGKGTDKPPLGRARRIASDSHMNSEDAHSDDPSVGREYSRRDAVIAASKLLRDSDIDGQRREGIKVRGVLSVSAGYYQRVPVPVQLTGSLGPAGGYLSSSSLNTEVRSIRAVSDSSMVPAEDTAGELVASETAPASAQRLLLCSARVCESVVSVTPAVNDLGECSVGDFKVASFTVANHSDLPALLLPYVESETLAVAVKDTELRIAGRESRQIQVEYVARVENTEYRRSCFLFNVFNRRNSLTMEVRAKNVDTHDVLLHSKYYQLVTYNNRHQVQIFMDKCIFSRPNLRVFSVKNIHTEPLEIELLPTALPLNQQQGGWQGGDLGPNLQRDVQIFLVCCRPSSSAASATGCQSTTVAPAGWSGYQGTWTSSGNGVAAAASTQKSSIEQLKWGRAISPKSSAYMLDTLLSPMGGVYSAQQLPTSIAVANFVDTVKRGGNNVSLKDCISSLSVSASDKSPGVLNSPLLNTLPAPHASEYGRGLDGNGQPLQQMGFVSLMTRPGFPVSLFTEPEEVEVVPAPALSAAQTPTLREGMGQVEIARSDTGESRERKRVEETLDDRKDNREKEASLSASPCDIDHDEPTGPSSSDLLSAAAVTAETELGIPVVFCTGQTAIDRVKLLKKTYQELSDELQSIKEGTVSESMLLPLIGDTSGGGWDGGKIIVPPGHTVDLAVVLQPSMAPPSSSPQPQPASASEGLEEETTLTRHIQVRLLSFSSVSGSAVQKEYSVGPSRSGSQKQMEKDIETDRDRVERDVKGAVSQSILSLLKPRSLYLRAKATRSEMVLLQRNINFGKIIIGESASGVTHGVTIVNKSRLIPLAYNISKSGSYASGALRIPSGRKGLIAPLSSQIVVFVFKPTLPGVFEETLLIENIMEPGDKHSVVIKAKVAKMETFTLTCDTPTLTLNQILNPYAASSPSPIAPISAALPTAEGATSPSSSIGDAIVTPRGHLSKTSSREDIEGALDKDKDGEKDKDKERGAKEMPRDRERDRDRAAVATAVVPVVALGTIAVGEQCEVSMLFRIRNVTLKARTFIVDATHADAVHCILPTPSHTHSHPRSNIQQNRGLPTITPHAYRDRDRDGDSESVQSIVSASSTYSPVPTPSAYAFEPSAEVLQSVTMLRCRFLQLQTERADEQSQTEQQKMGDKLEFFQQKLKIALRKNKLDKIDKYQSKIKDLHVSLNIPEGDRVDTKASPASTQEETEDEKREEKSLSPMGGDDDEDGDGERIPPAEAADTSTVWDASKSGALKLGVNVVSDSDVTLHLALGPGEDATVQVHITLLPGLSYKHWAGALAFKGYLRVFECRNEDLVKTLNFQAMVYPSKRALLAASATPGGPTRPLSGRQSHSQSVSEGVIPTDIKGAAGGDSDRDEASSGGEKIMGTGTGTGAGSALELSTVSKESDDCDDLSVYYRHRSTGGSDASLLSFTSEFQGGQDHYWGGNSLSSAGRYCFPPIQNSMSSNGSASVRGSRSCSDATAYKDDQFAYSSVDISSMCLTTVAQWSSYPTKQIFPTYRDRLIEVSMPPGSGQGYGPGSGSGMKPVAVKTRLLGMSVKLVQATKDRFMEGVLHIASLSPFQPTRSHLTPFGPHTDRGSTSPSHGTADLKVRISIEESFDWRSVISTHTLTHEDSQTKVTPYCLATHGPVILVPSIASQSQAADTFMATSTLSPHTGSDGHGPVAVAVIPGGGKLDCRVQWKPLSTLREELMVVAMIRVEVEVPGNALWSSPQFVPAVCFLEHRSRFKVDRLLNFGDVALGSTKTASATLRIKISQINGSASGGGGGGVAASGGGGDTGDISAAEGATAAGHPVIEDFHYVAMLVPPSASARAVGSLVIASGQNGVLVPSRSATKSIDVLFSASGTSLGRFEQELWIVSLADRLDQKRISCTAMVVPSQSQFVDFPDLKYDTVTGKLQQLELGLIQIQSAAWNPASNPPHSRRSRNNYHLVKTGSTGYPLFSLPLTTAQPAHAVSERSPETTNSTAVTGTAGGASTVANPQYVHKLRVANVSNKDLLVTAVSNLKSQCFLFSDPQCTVPVVESLLPARGTDATLVVYVVIRPSALLSLPSSSPALDKLKESSNNSSSSSSSNNSSNSSAVPGSLNASESDLAGAGSKVPSAPKTSTAASRALSGRELVGGIRLLFFEAPVAATDTDTDTEKVATGEIDRDREKEKDKERERDTSMPPPVISRKLFESTVVFRAVVGQSVLKARVLNPSLSLLSPRGPKLNTSAPPLRQVAIGQISVTNASPTFPLRYTYQTDQGTAGSSSSRVRCLAAVEPTSEGALRRYVLSSLADSSALSDLSSSSSSSSSSLLVIIGTKTGTGEGDRQGGTVPAGQSITVTYAIVAPSSPSPPSTGPYEGLCVHDLDLHNSDTGEVTSLSVSALFHTGRLTVSTVPSEDQSPTTSSPSSPSVLSFGNGVTSMIPALTCRRPLRVTRFFRQGRSHTGGELSAHIDEGINSSNTHFGVSDTIGDGNNLSAPPLSTLTLQSADHFSRSNSGGDGDGLFAGASCVRVVPVSNLSLRVVPREEVGSGSPSRLRDADRRALGLGLDQDMRFGLSVGGGLRVCGEMLSIPLGGALEVEVCCRGGETPNYGLLVKGGGFASVLAHTMASSSSTASSAKALSVRGVLGFLLLPPDTGDSGPYAFGSADSTDRDRERLHEGHPALSMLDRDTDVTASIKKLRTMGSEESLFPMANDTGRGEGQKKEGEKVVEEEKKKGGIVPSPSYSLLSIFDESPSSSQESAALEALNMQFSDAESNPVSPSLLGTGGRDMLSMLDSLLDRQSGRTSSPLKGPSPLAAPHLSLRSLSVHTGGGIGIGMGMGVGVGLNGDIKQHRLPPSGAGVGVGAGSKSSGVPAAERTLHLPLMSVCVVTLDLQLDMHSNGSSSNNSSSNNNNNNSNNNNAIIISNIHPNSSNNTVSSNSMNSAGGNLTANKAESPSSRHDSEPSGVPA